MFQIGDLIKWYELYGDIHIVRDAGIGIILETMDICYGEHNQTIYKVFRNEKQDSIMLEEHCIEKFEGE